MTGPEDIAGLAAAMAALGIARLTLTGPGFELALDRGETAARVADAPGDGPEPEAEAALTTVTAPSIGVFLRAHPLHDAPLAAVGAAVVAGQALALLRVGDLLTPVPAPADGVIVAALPADGALVGYGDRLFDFLPND